MDLQRIKKQAIPHTIAIVVFIALTVVFYYPLIVGDKTLDQHDINQGIASGIELTEFRTETGEEGLWANSMFSGMPAYLINVRWTGSAILTTIEKVISFGFPSSARETFLSMLCFYVLLVVFGVRPSLAIAGAIAYGFSTFFIISIQAGHIWKVRAIAYAPLVIAGVQLLYARKYIVGTALTALALALEINSNHLQITYYLLLILVLYGIVSLYTAVKNKDLVPFVYSNLLVVVAVIIAVGANLGKIWSTYEYGKYSMRGKSELASNTDGGNGLDKEYVFRWSSGKLESFTFLVPNFYGGASGRYNGSGSELEKVLQQNNAAPDQIQQYTRGLLGYWGTQPGVAGPAYAGAIICFLFVLGILCADTKYRVWLITATVLGIVLSWGKNFPSLNYLLYDILPYYSKFRSVSMTVVISLLTMPLLGFIGLEKLFQEPKKERVKKLLLAFGITAGVSLLVAIIAYVPAIDFEMQAFLKNAVDASRKSIVRMDAFRSFFFIAATFAAIYFFLKEKLSVGIFAVVLSVLITLDIVGVDYRYINSDSYLTKRKDTFLQQTPADQVILQDKSLSYRVLNFADPFNEARTSAFHNSIGGYHGAKIGRYQDLIVHQLSGEIQEIMTSGRITPGNTRLLSMLNTKYFLVGNTAESVVENPNALGNAWFVQSLKQVNTPDEELASLSDLPVKSEAVMDVTKFKKPEFQYDSSSSITLKFYAPNKLVYESTSSVNGYAVFSEIYYPAGWKAFIDNTEVSIDRVNYILRGLQVPAGTHQIEFKFEPNAYFVGNNVSLVFSIMLLLSIIAASLYSLKSTKNA